MPTCNLITAPFLFEQNATVLKPGATEVAVGFDEAPVLSTVTSALKLLAYDLTIRGWVRATLGTPDAYRHTENAP